RIGSFRNKVRDVFRCFISRLVKNLKLAFGGFKPFKTVPFQNNRKTAFRIGIEFYKRIQAF
ncbi:MAG: hypothetical protein LBL07_01730, partial [Tannerella sp.]|nr:hypothetical protein [Tannerella sp.]